MACAPSEDSDHPGHTCSLISVFALRMKKAWVLSYPLSAQRRLWSEWANAQADLNLRWAHSHFVGFVIYQSLSRLPVWDSQNCSIIFLLLSWQSHYRVTDEAFLAETSKGPSTFLRMFSLLLKERIFVSYFVVKRLNYHVWFPCFVRFFLLELIYLQCSWC